MASAECPECGKEISSQSIACPSCTYPMKDIEGGIKNASPPVSDYLKLVQQRKLLMQQIEEIYKSLPFWASYKPVGYGFLLGIVLLAIMAMLGIKDGYALSVGIFILFCSITVLPLFVMIRQNIWNTKVNLPDIRSELAKIMNEKSSSDTKLATPPAFRGSKKKIGLYIVAGDFKAGKWDCDVHIESGTIVLKNGFLAPKTSLKTESVEQVTEESKGKILRTAGWGLVGLGLLGPFGALAGMLGTRNKTDVCFAYTSTEGKRFLATTDMTSYKYVVGTSFTSKY